jgi:hypothetical protein
MEASRKLSPPELEECIALKNEVREALRAEASWEPVALYSVEDNGVASTTGLNFGVRVASQEHAHALYVTSLLLAKRDGA